MQHTLVALVQDRPGVLNRAVSVFRRRSINIESLTVAQTECEGISRITCLVSVSDITPLVAQLQKLVDVLDVYEIQRPADHYVEPTSSNALTQADGIA